MEMPEATMNEKYLAPRSENQVWAARQILRAKTIAIAHPMHKPPNNDFRPGIARPYQSHADASLGRRQCLHAYFFFAAFFFSRRFFNRASFFRKSSLGTLNIVRTALSSRSHGVLPATSGVGNGFIHPP
jgi:hypothetical protein